MQSRYISIFILGATLSTPALADHNSKWGEGWAKMPNDIHNTRIETRSDNKAFRDFVRYGNGADSENRFTTSDVRGRSQAKNTSLRQQSKTRSMPRRRR